MRHIDRVRNYLNRLRFLQSRPPQSNSPEPEHVDTPKDDTSKKQEYLNMANRALDYINSGSLNHARDDPGQFFNGLSSAVELGSALPGKLGMGVKILEGGLG